MMNYQLLLDATVQRPNGSIVSVKQFSQSENPNSVGCFSYSSEYGDLLRVTEYGWMLNSEEVFIHSHACTYNYLKNFRPKTYTQQIKTFAVQRKRIVIGFDFLAPALATLNLKIITSLFHALVS